MNHQKWAALRTASLEYDMQGCFSFNLPGTQGWAVEPLLTQVDPLDPKSSPVQLSTQLATPWLDGMQSGPEGGNCWCGQKMNSIVTPIGSPPFSITLACHQARQNHHTGSHWETHKDQQFGPREAHQQWSETCPGKYSDLSVSYNINAFSGH